jgi:MoxR-like ATPase
MANTISPTKPTFILPQLGVYGFNHLEPIILAALVTEDPLLLIGKSGTGKTFLLNSLSEALSLNHKHYNASYLSFDDLIGFPFPSSDGKSIHFIPTPATIWDAESVLIDELSRCKPEVQNKFFSIVQEKKIQGIYLDKLQYRWAAMNPIADLSNDVDDYYEGSISLDQALADRFAFVLEVPDWDEIAEDDQVKIIHPAGEGAITEVTVDLSIFIDHCKTQFKQLIQHPPYEIIKYCQIATTMMTDAGFRISPRRARLMARNLTALLIVHQERGIDTGQLAKWKFLKLGLQWSLPHRAYKKMKDVNHIIETVHESALCVALESKKDDRWLLDFNISHSITKKLDMLLDDNVPSEIKSIAIIQCMHHSEWKEKAILAFTTQPFFAAKQTITQEAINTLTEVATQLFYVDGALKWIKTDSMNDTMHPLWTACAKYIANMPIHWLNRKKRAKQLFLFLIMNKSPIENIAATEQELEDCFIKVQQKISNKNG